MSQPFVFRNTGQGKSGVWHLLKPIPERVEWRLLARSWCGQLWTHADPNQQRPREYAREVPMGDRLCKACQSFADTFQAAADTIPASEDA